MQRDLRLSSRAKCLSPMVHPETISQKGTSRPFCRPLGCILVSRPNPTYFSLSSLAMKIRLLFAALLATALTGQLRAADEPEKPVENPPAEKAEKKSSARDALRAQMIEDAKKQAAALPPRPPAPKPNPIAKPDTASSATTPPAPAPTSPTALIKADIDKAAVDADAAKPAATSPAPKAGDTPAAVLPKVEVNRTKPTEAGRMMYEQEKEIAREKKLTKSSELDKALNNSKVSLPIFGGQTTASRESVASERVSLMEEERDLIEEIAHAKTKEQKAELTKQLNEIKKIRRELEQAIH